MKFYNFSRSQTTGPYKIRNIFHIISRKINQTIGKSVEFTDYLRYHEIINYIETLCTQKSCTLLELGKSHEGRRIVGIKIGSDQSRAIVIDAGVHAREWITTMTALYSASRIATEPHMVENVQWVIIPLLNPDGYTFSWTKNNRLWRKNMVPTKIASCLGVDINRNFDSGWDTETKCCLQPCSETYRGNHPWSEIESRIIKQLVHSLGNRISLYLSLHNYLQGILYPWGFTMEPPKDVNQLIHLAKKAQVAIRNKYGTIYRVGQISSIDALTPGCSVDWVKEKENIAYSYTIELPGPIHQFHVPPNYLEKMASEYYEALIMFRETVGKGVI